MGQEFARVSSMSKLASEQPTSTSPGPGVVELSVVIATHNRSEMLARCLRSIYDTIRRVAFEVIVVDDASTDGTTGMIQEQFPAVRLIRNPAQASWTVTNNQGIRHSRGDFLLLLNDDTRLLPEALDRAVDFMRRHPKAGVVTPRILNPDGSVQPTVRQFPNLAAALAQSVDLHRLLPGNWLTRRYYAVDFDYTITQQAELVGTTCYLLRRDCYAEVGEFDESFPPNFSDPEFNFRVKEAGWEIWVLAEGEIIHYGGATMGLLNLRQLREFHRGMFKMYRKHYAPRRNPVINGIVYLGIAVRYLLKAVLRLTLLDRLLHRLPQPHRRREPVPNQQTTQ